MAASGERSNTKRLLEVCVDDMAGVEAALRGGADRIELCSALQLGGLTPSAGLIAAAKNMADDYGQRKIAFIGQRTVPIHAMVRPRAGDFVYTDAELDCMERDIDHAREAGLAGVVFGANMADGSGRLEADALRRLMTRAQGLDVTLHRCFDLVPDLEEALAVVAGAGIRRVLTSGRAPVAYPDGLGDLRETVRIVDTLFGGRISVMPGAGLRPENTRLLLAQLPAIGEVHGSCSNRRPPTDPKPAQAAAIQQQQFCALLFGEPSAARTDADLVRAMKAVVVSVMAREEGESVQ